MKRRFNLFQVMMLRWRELYPYSAVHAVRVEAPLVAKRLESAIAAALEERGLAGLEIDSRSQRYEWRGGAPTAQLEVVPGGSDARVALDQEIERQLNRPFAADGSVEPFRFFAIEAGPAFHLGLAYDHIVAGGDSVARLLKSIVARYGDAQQYLARLVPNPYAPRYAGLFRRDMGAFLSGLATLPRLAAECRRSARPGYASPEDGYNAFIRFRIDEAGRGLLESAATAWRVSHSDLFLAITLLALSPLAVERWNAKRRRELGLASIVNIRRELGAEAADAFGPCLASFRVAHPVPQDIGVRELASALHAHTEEIRRRKLYLQTLLAMALSGFEWRFLSRRRRLRFFAKHYPVWAGLTPLNLKPLWSDHGGGGAPPEYVRAVSTGPLAPMIVAPTSSDEAIEVGIAFRTTVYSRDAAARFAAGMLESISRLEHCT